MHWLRCVIEFRSVRDEDLRVISLTVYDQASLNPDIPDDYLSKTRPASTPFAVQV